MTIEELEDAIKLAKMDGAETVEAPEGTIIFYDNDSNEVGYIDSHDSYFCSK